MRWLMCLASMGWIACAMDAGGGMTERPLAPLAPLPDGADWCAELTLVLRSCGNLGAGILDCEQPRGPRERCSAQCLLAAPCDDFDTIYCAQQNATSSRANASTDHLSDTLRACLARCPVRSACASGHAIESWQWCNGFSDCFDGSDELDCDFSRDFICRDGSRVSPLQVCDQVPHCSFGEDEMDCPPTFACGAFELPASVRCDGEINCPGGEDEVACPVFVEPTCSHD